MTSLCFSFGTLLVVVNPILGADYDSFRSDLNSEGRPILRGGFGDLLDNINLDINVRVEPSKQKSHEDLPKIVEALQQSKAVDISMLRKRPKSSEEVNSDIDEKLPKLRTAAPDNSVSNETEEAFSHLSKDDTEDKSPEDKVVTSISAENNKSPEDEVVSLISAENNKSPEDKVVSLISGDSKSSEEKTARLIKEVKWGSDSEEQATNTFDSEENSSGVDKLRMESAGNSEWMKDLRSYVKILASKYQKDGMLAHIKPVVKVLERTHNIKIKDIDVNQNGNVKIDYRSNDNKVK